ncbi:MAG: prolyl oligopeptidase family serine peptidase [Saprospiraceae bacterium]|nr:prolyl oligopeptidase family serine peptidase [Saprospiraceae bacterium]
MHHIFSLVILILYSQPALSGQAITKPASGSDTSPSWDPVFQVVEISSSLDGEMQKAYYRRAEGVEEMPLLVSLHSWSGDYTQFDSLSLHSLSKNWNYIHPDFRGPNNRYEACGSRQAISDIDDAIQFAIDQGKVDLDNIHVIGSSGGGHATLLTFMKSRHNIKSFSAWVPISNLTDWYFESLGRQQKYAAEILLSTRSKPDSLNHGELNRRSPIFLETQWEQRKNSWLNIYAGIHDGYEGSVPVSHSLEFYNKVVSDLGGASEDLVSTKIILDLVKMRTYPEKTNQMIGDREIIFQKQFENISLILFDGGHEMLVGPAWKMLTVTGQK